MKVPLSLLLCAPLLALAAESDTPVKPGGEWQKIETKLVPIAQPRQILSPGLFDHELLKVVTLPKDGTPADLGLPHAGKDKNGKEYPALTARIAQHFVWVDFNGDGRASADETRSVEADGYTDVFSCTLHYEDGTAAPYSFRLKSLGDDKYAVQRACARVAEVNGQKLVLLDENGNGKYNEADKDALIAGDAPVAFVGKYVQLGNKFFELLVHEAGTLIEVRPVPEQNFPLGYVDIFEKHKAPQKAENLHTHMIIISGAEGSFAFDERRRKIKVPAGAYDITFGLFERAKEIVYMKKGEKTTFTVEGEKTAAPAWGADVEARFTVKAGPKPVAKPEPKANPEKAVDENFIIVSPPTFVGAGSEQYFPENYKIIPVTAAIAQVMADAKMRADRSIPVGSHRYDVLPNGDLAPTTFKPARNYNDEYEITVDYNSGILGSVNTKQRFRFTYRKPVK
ncbi:MAG TPA: hypothetical protein VGP72_08160 [Planctomycetota bacterium]|jgi:hypothetical protein